MQGRPYQRTLRVIALLMNLDRAVGIQQRQSHTLTDDIALLSQSFAGMQKVLLDVEREASIVGLKINVSKTQHIMVGDWPDHSQEDRVLRVADGTTALVDDFKYLGS